MNSSKWIFVRSKRVLAATEAIRRVPLIITMNLNLVINVLKEEFLQWIKFTRYFLSAFIGRLSFLYHNNVLKLKLLFYFSKMYVNDMWNPKYRACWRIQIVLNGFQCLRKTDNRYIIEWSFCLVRKNSLSFT